MSLRFTKVKETCLYVKDLDATEGFYHKKLGMEVISKVEERHIFFRAGESVLLCFLPESTKEESSLPPHFGSGELHYALECEVVDYEKWKQKFKEENIPIEHETDWRKGLKSFYFRDPDNHLGEIVMKGIWG